MTDPNADRLARLLAALEKLPISSGVVWRGVPEALAGVVQLTGPTPTSRDPRVAGENGSAPVLLAIASRTGRLVAFLSGRPAESEVLLLPGILLAPIGPARDLEGATVQFVEELAQQPGDPGPADMPADVADFELRAREALAAAGHAGPVEVTSPGKYSGPLFVR